ncbi:MAG: DEAD/DEAH box helicase [Alphaproteobacteria bacterium]|nr:DEAD/DEAH box helicase [Alphaproteobacteria bacterium]
MSFNDLGLSAEVLRAIGEAGFTEPTPIQSEAIPHVLTGRDILARAQTGTGKTAAFTLPMIDILAAGRAKARMPRALILEPTRELAQQVEDNFKVYGKFNKLSAALVIGGASMSQQEAALNRGVDVLIATPGRLIDLFERGKVLLSQIRVLVIDEADRMMDMGFMPDVEKIVSLLPFTRQTLLFSATIPDEIRRLSDRFLSNPKEIEIQASFLTADTIEDAVVVVNEEDKREALRMIVEREELQNALIFCNRKRDADILYRSLKKHGFNVGVLHGDLAQSVREETLQGFRDGKITLLVASDVAARGLDIRGLSHVFNFDVPFNAEDYVHRIGRTGRAGKGGRAFTLATPDDAKLLSAIKHLIGREIPRIEIEGLSSKPPTGGDGERPRRDDGRRGGRGRRPRRGESSRGEAPAPRAEAPRQEAVQAPYPADAPQPVAEAAPVAEVRHEPAPQPQREEQRPRREDRKPRREDHKPRREARPGAGNQEHRHEGRRRDQGDSDGPSSPGLGDHVPAFLMRKPRPPTS